jgi:hypothetical protein
LLSPVLKGCPQQSGFGDCLDDVAAERADEQDTQTQDPGGARPAMTGDLLAPSSSPPLRILDANTMVSLSR